MKKYVFFLLVMVFSFSSLGTERNHFNNYYKKQSSKYSKLAKSKLDSRESLGDKNLVCRKSGKHIGIYQDSSKKYKIYKRKRKFLTRLFRRLFGSVEILQVESQDENILKLKLTHKRNKYNIEKVYYRVGSFWSRTQKAKTYTENGETFVNIDVTNIPFGEYKGYFKFLASKIRKKAKKKKKYKVFYGYGSFNKVETIKAFANFSIDHDPTRGFLRVDGSESTSEVGNIVEYTYRSFLNNEIVETFTSDVPVLFLTFKSQGDFEIELTVEDDSGNFGASERQTVTITNAVPDAKFLISQNTELQGHYNVDARESTDFEGPLAGYQILLYLNGENGLQRVADFFSENPEFSFAVPEANVEYTVTLRAYDQEFQFNESASTTVKFEGSSLSPKYMYHYIEPDENLANQIYFGAGYTDDGEIVEYNYRVLDQDGNELPLRDDKTVKDNGVTLSQPGIYTFEFQAVDNDGLVSDKIVVTREFQWTPEQLIPVYIYHEVHVSEFDPRVYFIFLDFQDPLGEVVDYEFSITHDEGDSIQPVFDIAGSRQLIFTKEGNWNFSIVAIDNEGNKSLPLEFTQNIDFGGFKTTASISLESQEGNPNEIKIVNPVATPRFGNTHNISARHTDGDLVEYTFTDDNLYSFILPKKGNWVIEYYIVDFLGFKSETQVINFEVIIPDIIVDFNVNPSGNNGDYVFQPILNQEFSRGRLFVTAPSGQVSYYETLEEMNIDLLQNGTWIFEYSAEVDQNVASLVARKEISVTNLRFEIIGVSSIEITEGERISNQIRVVSRDNESYELKLDIEDNRFELSVDGNFIINPIDDLNSIPNEVYVTLYVDESEVLRKKINLLKLYPEVIATIPQGFSGEYTISSTDSNFNETKLIIPASWTTNGEVSILESKSMQFSPASYISAIGQSLSRKPIELVIQEGATFSPGDRALASNLTDIIKRSDAIPSVLMVISNGGDFTSINLQTLSICSAGKSLYAYNAFVNNKVKTVSFKSKKESVNGTNYSTFIKEGIKPVNEKISVPDIVETILNIIDESKSFLDLTDLNIAFVDNKGAIDLSENENNIAFVRPLLPGYIFINVDKYTNPKELRSTLIHEKRHLSQIDTIGCFARLAKEDTIEFLYETNAEYSTFEKLKELQSIGVKDLFERPSEYIGREANARLPNPFKGSNFVNYVSVSNLENFLSDRKIGIWYTMSYFWAGNLSFDEVVDSVGVSFLSDTTERREVGNIFGHDRSGKELNKLTLQLLFGNIYNFEYKELVNIFSDAVGYSGSTSFSDLDLRSRNKYLSLVAGEAGQNMLVPAHSAVIVEVDFSDIVDEFDEDGIRYTIEGINYSQGVPSIDSENELVITQFNIDDPSFSRVDGYTNSQVYDINPYNTLNVTRNIEKKNIFQSVDGSARTFFLVRNITDDAKSIKLEFERPPQEPILNSIRAISYRRTGQSTGALGLQVNFKRRGVGERFYYTTGAGEQAFTFVGDPNGNPDDILSMLINVTATSSSSLYEKNNTTGDILVSFNTTAPTTFDLTIEGFFIDFEAYYESDMDSIVQAHFEADFSIKYNLGENPRFYSGEINTAGQGESILTLLRAFCAVRHIYDENGTIVDTAYTIQSTIDGEGLNQNVENCGYETEGSARLVFTSNGNEIGEMPLRLYDRTYTIPREEQ